MTSRAAEVRRPEQLGQHDDGVAAVGLCGDGDESRAGAAAAAPRSVLPHQLLALVAARLERLAVRAELYACERLGR